MTVVLVLGAIAVVAAILIRAMWRGSVDERHSVRDYHQTLETLRNLSDRSAPRTEQRPQPRPEATPSSRQDATRGARQEVVAASSQDVTRGARQEAAASARPEGSAKSRGTRSGRTLLGRSSSAADSLPTRQQEVVSGQGVEATGRAAEQARGTATSAASEATPAAEVAPRVPVTAGSTEGDQTTDGDKQPDFVFDDSAAGPAARSGVSSFKMTTGEAAFTSRASGRALTSRWSIPATSRRGGLFAVAVVVVLVALVAALVTIGISSSGGKHASSTAHAATHGSSHASTNSASHSTSHGSTTGGSHSSTSAGSPVHRSGKKKSKSSTTTTAPTLQPTTSSAAEAAYAAPASGYTVALSATAPCWVEAEEVATGTVVYTGTLSPGQSQQFAASGDLFVRLGAAFVVTVSLNGEPITLPTGHQSPFNVTFQAT
jgi:hypothetical protein